MSPAQYPVAERGSQVQLSFPVSFMGETVMTAEVKSTNSIRMQLFLLSRCVKAEWRAADTSSSGLEHHTLQFDTGLLHRSDWQMRL